MFYAFKAFPAVSCMAALGHVTCRTLCDCASSHTHPELRKVSVAQAAEMSTSLVLRVFTALVARHYACACASVCGVRRSAGSYVAQM